MLQSVPGWVQAGIAVLLLIGMVVAFGVHIQDGVRHNNEAIGQVEIKVDEVDDIVRDNQQRLAHIEALLEYERRNLRAVPIPNSLYRGGTKQDRAPDIENDPYESP